MNNITKEDIENVVNDLFKDIPENEFVKIESISDTHYFISGNGIFAKVKKSTWDELVLKSGNARSK